MSGAHLSKDFFLLVKAIGESKSKQEEDRIIHSEVAQLKVLMGNRHLNKKRMKEFLIRLVYAEMLGHDASFGYIRAIELTASSLIIHKRTGYLCASLCLSPEHEFRFMMVNQLQRDMDNSNILVICAALTALCKLVTAEMIPALLQHVVKLMAHDQPIVRKKVVMALMRFWQLMPESVTEYITLFRKALCDKDPSVMGASLPILLELAKEDASSVRDLAPSFVSVLKQITEHRLPRDFDYHRIPAPWIQINLLKILGYLGNADQSTSEHMYEVLHQVMKRADTGINVGYAIVYECIRTITRIYPNAMLLDTAAASISRFIGSENQNLKYFGVTALAQIVQDHPSYAGPHQMIVLDCLEDPDETIQRRTLDLLYRMTTPKNVKVVVSKMQAFLKKSKDQFLRKELVQRLTQLAERFAPDATWYVDTMAAVIAAGGDLVEPRAAHNLRKLIAEGSGDEDEDEIDEQIRQSAVNTLLGYFDRPYLPDILQQIMAWVIGEYGYTIGEARLPEMANKLCELADRPDSTAVTKSYIVTALIKLTAQMGTCPPSTVALIERYGSSADTDLMQRCYEFGTMLRSPGLISAVFPVDASLEDLEVDENLGFLDGFVQEQLAAGAKPYRAPEDRDEGLDIEAFALGGAAHDAGSSLNFEAYAKPEIPTGGDMGAEDYGEDMGGDGGGYGGGGGDMDGMGGGGDEEGMGGDMGGDMEGMDDDFGDEDFGALGGDGAWGEDMGSSSNNSAAAEAAPAASSGPTSGVSDGSDFGGLGDLGGGSGGSNAMAAAPEPEDEYEEVWAEETVVVPAVEPTQKEIEAAALFGQPVPAPKPATTRTIRKLVRRKKERAHIASPAPAAASGGLGGGLDDMFGTPAPAPAPAPAPSGGDDLLDFLGGGGGSSSSSSSTSNRGFDWANVQPSATVARALASGSRVPANSAALGGHDDTVYISYVKSRKEKALMLAVFCSNTSGQPISDFVIGFNVPASDLKVAYAGEPKPVVQGNTARFSLPANGKSTLMAQVTLASPNGMFAPTLAGVAQYNGGASRIEFKVETDLHDWLRPLSLTVPEFGGKWTAGSMREKRVTVPASFSSTQELLGQVVSGGLALKQVQARASEGILSGTIAGTPVVILVHGKIGPSTSITVKTQVPALSEKIAALVQQALS